MLPRALAFALLMFGVITATAVVRYGEKKAGSSAAPADEFSGERAREILATLVSDGRPHPTGSKSNVRVRETIVAELSRLGYAPAVQNSFACGKYGSCAFVSNVATRLEGRSAGPAVLVSAHYDSVAAGPGANDDGSGVASILELARALKAGPKLEHSVILLLDDGEEAGLNGAEAFARDNPWMRDVRATVNLDARGSSGPSMLFETSSNNAWIIDLAASVLPRPVTSSLYYALYQRMPNDTDFTIFKRTSQGANFAYTGSIENYHTPLDRLENTRAGVLQQQGENALAMVRAFASSNIASTPRGDAVWFDVLATFIVRWKEPWTIWISGASLLMAVSEAARRIRKRTLPLGELATGFLAMPLTVVAGALSSMLVAGLARIAGGLPAPWVATAVPLLAALYLAAFSSALALANFAIGRASPESLRLGMWLAWALIGTAAACVVPGASFLFVVPALAAAFFGLFAPTNAMGPFVCALAAAIAACLWIPVLLLLYPSIGMVAPAAHGATLGVLLTSLLPLAAALSARVRIRLALASTMIAFGFLLVVIFVSPFSPSVPSRANVVFQEDASTNQARNIVDPTLGGFTWGEVPNSMRLALGESAHEDQRFPWTTRDVIAADANYLGLPAPELVTSDTTAEPSGRRVRARLQSPRGANALYVVFPPSSQATIVRANGIPMTNARPLTSDGWRCAAFFAVPLDGIELELSLGLTPVEIHLVDQTAGVPQASTFVIVARPPTAVPTQDGDVTTVTKVVHL